MERIMSRLLIALSLCTTLMACSGNNSNNASTTEPEFQNPSLDEPQIPIPPAPPTFATLIPDTLSANPPSTSPTDPATPVTPTRFSGYSVNDRGNLLIRGRIDLTHYLLFK